MHTIYKTTAFEAAHLLKGHPKCGKLHGHSYKAEVWITAKQINDPYGFVLDFHEISDYFKQFDHSGKTLKLSAEELAQDAAFYFRKLFLDNDRQFISIKVRLWETATGYAEYEVNYE